MRFRAAKWSVYRLLTVSRAWERFCEFQSSTANLKRDVEEYLFPSCLSSWGDWKLERVERVRLERGWNESDPVLTSSSYLPLRSTSAVHHLLSILPPIFLLSCRPAGSVFACLPACLYICLCVCLSACVSVCLFVYLLVYLSIYMSLLVHTPVCKSVYTRPFTCLSVSQFVYLFLCFSIHTSVCLYLCLCIHPPYILPICLYACIYMFVYLSVCLSVYLTYDTCLAPNRT